MNKSQVAWPTGCTTGFNHSFNAHHPLPNCENQMVRNTKLVEDKTIYSEVKNLKLYAYYKNAFSFILFQ